MPDPSNGLAAEAEQSAMLAQSLLVEQAKIGPERAKSSQAIQQMVGRTSARRRSHAKNMARAARTNMAREFNQSAADSMPAVRLRSGDPVPQEPALPSLSSSPWTYTAAQLCFHWSAA